MSAAVGAVSSTTKEISSFNTHLEEELKNKLGVKNDGAANSDNIDAAEEEEETETEDDNDDSSSRLEESDKELDVGPQFSLKEHLEKDKHDESLRKWKEQLLGSVDMSVVGERKEPEVKIQSFIIASPGRADQTLPIPFTNNPKNALFILKEGSKCRMKFAFTVSNNIVSGLTYTNVVWKTGIRVDSRKRMLGTYSPQQEPYIFELEEETTPTGMFARGTYAARTKFVDDDRKCYLDVSYYFEIQKNWGTSQ